MSPTRRQLLQGIAALAVAPSQGLAPVASPSAMELWFLENRHAYGLALADMPDGWDRYDDLDRELMATCGPDGYQV